MYIMRRRRLYALDQNSLGSEFFFYLLGHLFGSILTRIVIDGHITAFSRELLCYKCAKAPTDFGRDTSASSLSNTTLITESLLLYTLTRL